MQIPVKLNHSAVVPISYFFDGPVPSNRPTAQELKSLVRQALKEAGSFENWAEEQDWILTFAEELVSPFWRSSPQPILNEPYFSVDVEIKGEIKLNHGPADMHNWNQCEIFDELYQYSNLFDSTDRVKVKVASARPPG